MLCPRLASSRVCTFLRFVGRDEMRCPESELCRSSGSRSLGGKGKQLLFWVGLAPLVTTLCEHWTPRVRCVVSGACFSRWNRTIRKQRLLGAMCSTCCLVDARLRNTIVKVKSLNKSNDKALAHIAPSLTVELLEYGVT